MSVHNLWKFLTDTLRKRRLLMAKGIDFVVRSRVRIPIKSCLNKLFFRRSLATVWT